MLHRQLLDSDGVLRLRVTQGPHGNTRQALVPTQTLNITQNPTHTGLVTTVQSNLGLGTTLPSKQTSLCSLHFVFENALMRTPAHSLFLMLPSSRAPLCCHHPVHHCAVIPCTIVQGVSPGGIHDESVIAAVCAPVLRGPGIRLGNEGECVGAWLSECMCVCLE